MPSRTGLDAYARSAATGRCASAGRPGWPGSRARRWPSCTRARVSSRTMSGALSTLETVCRRHVRRAGRPWRSSPSAAHSSLSSGLDRSNRDAAAIGSFKFLGCFELCIADRDPSVKSVDIGAMPTATTRRLACQSTRPSMTAPAAACTTWSPRCCAPRPCALGRPDGQIRPRGVAGRLPRRPPRAVRRRAAARRPRARADRLAAPPARTRARFVAPGPLARRPDPRPDRPGRPRPAGSGPAGSTEDDRGRSTADRAGPRHGHRRRWPATSPPIEARQDRPAGHRRWRPTAGDRAGCGWAADGVDVTVTGDGATRAAGDRPPTRAALAGRPSPGAAGHAALQLASPTRSGRDRCPRPTPSWARAARSPPPTAGSRGWSTAPSTTCAALRLAEPRAPRRHLPRRRRALVPHPVRPGQPLGRPDAAAARHRPGRRHAARAGPPPGHPGRPGHRRGSPARSCTSCAGTSSRSTDGGLPAAAGYYGTVDATPLWISLLHDAWRWGLPADAVDRAAAAPRGGAGAGWPSTATPTATASSSTSTTPAAAWPTRAGRTPATRCGSATARLAAPPIALARCRGTRTEAAVDGAALLDALRPTRRRPLARRGPTAWPSGSGPRSGSTAATAPTRRWPSTGDKRPVDALTSNIGHLLGTGLLSRAEEADGRRACSPPRRWPAASACAPCPPATPGSARCRTTAARSGRTTPRSSLAGLARAGLRAAGGAPARRRPARRGRGVRLPAARAVRRRRPGDGSAGRCPTRPPAARRPGRRRRPSLLLQAGLGSTPTCRTAGSILRPLAGAPAGRAPRDRPAHRRRPGDGGGGPHRPPHPDRPAPLPEAHQHPHPPLPRHPHPGPSIMKLTALVDLPTAVDFMIGRVHVRSSGESIKGFVSGGGVRPTRTP